MHLALLFATLAALLSGPLLYSWAQQRSAVLTFLDGFLFVSIFGLVLLEAVPGTFSAGGWWSALFLIAGLLGPSLLEQGISHARRTAHLAALLLAILGLIAHSLGDGVALSSGGEVHINIALPIAVAVHSVPVGLVVWWLLFPVFGTWPPLLAILAMCAGTVVGYAFGPALGAALGATGWAWFQALVAGTILHVVFGRPHIDPDTKHHPTPKLEGFGNLCALLGLVALAQLDDEAIPAASLFAHFMHYALLLAPWLLGIYLLGALSAAPRGARAAWQRGGVRWIDTSAIWVLIGLLLLSCIALWFVELSPPQLPHDLQLLSLALLAVLYAASLLRNGGRAWIRRALPKLPHGHAH